MAEESKHAGGRPPVPKARDRFYLASLARDHSEAAIDLLVSTLNDANCKRGDRIKAAEILIERGWGKAPQEISIGTLNEEGLKLIVEVVNANATPKTERGQS